MTQARFHSLPACVGQFPPSPILGWLLPLMCALLSQVMAKEQLFVGGGGCGKNLDMGLGVHMGTWVCSRCVALYSIKLPGV